MYTISDTDRPESPGEESWEDRDPKPVDEADKQRKDLIAKANSVPMKLIFSFYGVKATEYNKRIVCPFKKHKGGKETTGSFWFYPDTNSFSCFGCHTTGGSCKFVAEMDRINQLDAAEKILSLYASDVDINFESQSTVDYSERLEIIMQFSDCMREYIQKNQFDETSLRRAEVISSVFDFMNVNFILDNEALKLLVEMLMSKIQKYSR